MKKNVFSRLGALVLTLAMLVPCVLCAPVGAAKEDYKLLYSWSAADHGLNENVRLIKNNSMPRVSYEVDPNKTQINSNTMPKYTFRTEEGEVTKQFFAMLINGGSTGGLNSVADGKLRKTTEALRIELTGVKEAGIAPSGYGAMAMTWLYAWQDGTDANSNILVEDNCIYTVYTNKGRSWSVGNRCWELLGTGEVSGERVLLYRFTSEDLMPAGVELAKNETINLVVMEPTGKLTNAITGRFRFTDLEIRGYESKDTFEKEFPGKTYTPVSEDTLRKIAVAEAERVSQITYDLDVDSYAEHAAGVSGLSNIKVREIWPAGVTYYGPLYQRREIKTREALEALIKDGKLTGGFAGDIVPGMDCGTYVYNAQSRVSRTAAWTSNRGLRDSKAFLLGDIKTKDANPKYTDVDVVAANDANTMYEAYAQAKAGDGLNRIFVSGSSVHMRLVYEDAVVVRNADGTIDPQKSYLSCIEQTSGMTWYIQFPDGTVQTMESKDYKVVLNTINAKPGSKLLFMTHTPKRTYTFAKLLSDGYIPYSLTEYKDQKVENAAPDFVMLNLDGKSPAGGVELVLSSNYRLINFATKLEDLEHGTVLYENLEYDSGRGFAYYSFPNCTKLNQVLQGLPVGSYRLTLSTTTGPVTTVGGAVPTAQRSVEFEVTGKRDKTTAKLTPETGALTAGQEVTVNVDLGHKFEIADVEIKFDTDALSYVSGELSTECLVGQAEADKGIVRIACAGAASNGALAKLTFRANADVAKVADAMFIKNIKTSTAASAETSDMKTDALEGKASASLRMGDVYPTAWYSPAVDYALENGIMGGYNNTTFGPNDQLSRAMVVQVLYNKEGQPAIEGGNKFPDVKGGDWFNNAVTWGAQKGVVGGYGDGRFGPNDNVTIEQIAVILWNYSGNPAVGGNAADLGAHSDWAANALGWAAGEGLFEGLPYEAVTDTATRAQTAQLLMKYLTK